MTVTACTPSHRKMPHHDESGFSLIEIAVVMFILVLLLGSVLVPLQTQVEQRQVSATEKTLDDIRQALLGFAVANGYLPCPDTDNDGAENVTAGLCTTIASNIAHGNLPWQTLGIADSDVWGNRFRYAVREQYARRAPSTPFTLNTTAPNLRVCTAAGCTSTLTSSAVAVVLSHGKNKTSAAGSGTADERENNDSDRDFVSRIITSADTAAGEFDDIVTWLPVYVLFNRMVSAGKLP
jgi:type II secretory pathway pseudopilin PulG